MRRLLEGGVCKRAAFKRGNAVCHSGSMEAGPAVLNFIVREPLFVWICWSSYIHSHGEDQLPCSGSERPVFMQGPRKLGPY